MLRQEQTGTENVAATPYAPIPRRDMMTDAHIEDFLDHQCAPLIGTMYYEERQQRRAEMRQQILSVAAAHEELGSTRGEAIAHALNSMAAPPVATTAQRTAPVLASRTRTGSAAASLKFALWSFGISAFASLTIVAANRNPSASTGALLQSLMLGAFPFAAGAFLGSKNSLKQFRGMLMAQLLLFLPLTLGAFLVASSQVANYPLEGAMHLSVVYTMCSTLFGGMGLFAGNRLKAARPRPGEQP